MNMLEVFERFPTHTSCIGHLETTRWKDELVYPHCDR